MTTNQTPSWVKREIRRLAKMAEMGGSSAAMIYQKQAADLAARHNAWSVYKLCSIFTGAVDEGNV